VIPTAPPSLNILLSAGDRSGVVGTSRFGVAPASGLVIKSQLASTSKAMNTDVQ
jgi:hypothetical protein